MELFYAAIYSSICVVGEASGLRALCVDSLSTTRLEMQKKENSLVEREYAMRVKTWSEAYREMEKLEIGLFFGKKSGLRSQNGAFGRQRNLILGGSRLDPLATTTSGR